jgi:hypothetical protein
MKALAPLPSAPSPERPTTQQQHQVIAAGDALGLDVRLAAAVNFKNLVKFCWVRWRRHIARARSAAVAAATACASVPQTRPLSL